MNESKKDNELYLDYLLEEMGKDIKDFTEEDRKILYDKIMEDMAKSVG